MDANEPSEGRAMADNPLAKVVHDVRSLVAKPAGEDQSDIALLRTFSTQNDQLAFAALVKRHGPLVLAVCRRVLHEEHDAEDAFQATFIVLARRAASASTKESLAGWLHGVAHQIPRN